MIRTDYVPADFETNDPEAARAVRLASPRTPATEQRTAASLGLDARTAADLDDNPDALDTFLAGAAS